MSSFFFIQHGEIICWIISHKYPFFMSYFICISQTRFGNKNTLRTIWTSYCLTTAMPWRSRKLPILHWADHRKSNCIVQTPRKAVLKTLVLALQPFSCHSSHHMNSSWKPWVFLHVWLQSSQPSKSQAQMGPLHAATIQTMTVLHRSRNTLLGEDAGHQRLFGASPACTQVGSLIL